MTPTTDSDIVNGGHAANGRTKYTVDSVSRALSLLRAFERPPHEFGASELARQLGITKNLAFRLLKTLEVHGFVHRVGDRYVIGMRVTELARFAVHHLELLRSAARPIMEELRNQTGETAYLTIVDGLDALCVDYVESESVVRGVLRVGARVPLHAGGATKVLLAHLPAERQDEVVARGLPAYTPGTITDPGVLAAELRKIRLDGYAVAEEEITAGADAVGAPVRDQYGVVVAGLGLVGPSGRLRARLHTDLSELVRDAADRVSRRLGYRGARVTAAGLSTG